MQMNAIYLLSLVVPATAMLRGTGDQTLVSDMRPDVVRKLLSNVEHKWIHTRAMVLANATGDDEAFPEMQASCGKISTAIVAGSEGQRDRVIEYMQDVCTDGKGLCSSFASGIAAVMTDDSEFNRDELQLNQFCRKFWDGAVTSAAQAEAKEQAQREVERKKKEEEDAKKAAEEAEKERVEKLRIEAEEAAKQKAAQEAAAQEAAQVKAYEAAKNQTNAASSSSQVNEASSSSQVNETSSVPVPPADQTNTTAVASSEANATTTPNEAAQSNNTVEASNGDSTGVATTENSTGTNTSVAAASAPETKTNSTSIAMIAHAAIKNATTLKNATAVMKK